MMFFTQLKKHKDETVTNGNKKIKKRPRLDEKKF